MSDLVIMWMASRFALATLENLDILGFLNMVANSFIHTLHNTTTMKTWTCILLIIAGLVILAHVIAAARVFYGILWDEFKEWIKKRKK